MKKYRILLCITVAAVMLLFPLTGCEKKDSEPADEPAVSDTPTSNDSVISDEPADSAEVSDEPTDAVVVIDEPTYDEVFLFSEGIDENGFWEGIRALDYVEMFNYRAMPIPNEIHAISDEAIQTEVDYILADNPAINHITDRAVIDGDKVNIDFVGSVDGVEFDNGSTGGEGVDVTIGVTTYIDDFLEQLIGHMPGETVNVEVTFPDEYSEPSLQGKDALFITEINYIVEEAEAELTDEFVMDNLSSYYEWTTVEELIEGIRSVLHKNALQQYVQNYLATEVVVQSIPDQVVTYQQKAMLNSYQEYAAYYGLELEDLIGYEGYTDLDEFIEANREGILQNATYYLVSQAVAEDAGILISDEDLVSFFTEYVGTSDYSMYEMQYGLPYLKQVALCQKILDYIIENAVLE